MGQAVEWQFVTSNLKRDDWRWRVVNENGKVLKQSRRVFRYFLEYVADAQRHGYNASAKEAARPQRNSVMRESSVRWSVQ